MFFGLERVNMNEYAMEDIPASSQSAEAMGPQLITGQLKTGPEEMAKHRDLDVTFFKTKAHIKRSQFYR